MSSSNHYDEHLLGSAPEATKEQRQEGYNVNLLEQNKPGQVGSLKTVELTPRSTDVESAFPVPKKYDVVPNEKGALHTRLLQSTKGKIAIFIALIVIIGAIVGGAVGGTVGKHNNLVSNSLSSTSNSTSASAGAPKTASTSTLTPASVAPTAAATTNTQPTGNVGPAPVVQASAR